MKLLLDECVPVDFRHGLPEHETHTAQWAGLKSKKNGELLRAAELAGYEVLVTVDQGLGYQQNLAKGKISVVSVRSKTNQLEDLLALIPAVVEALRIIKPGEVIRIE